MGVQLEQSTQALPLVCASSSVRAAASGCISAPLCCVRLQSFRAPLCFFTRNMSPHVPVLFLAHVHACTCAESGWLVLLVSASACCAACVRGILALAHCACCMPFSPCSCRLPGSCPTGILISMGFLLDTGLHLLSIMINITGREGGSQFPQESKHRNSCYCYGEILHRLSM